MRRILTPIALMLSVPAQAEVISSTENGFEVASSITVKAAPAAVFTMLGEPARWWSKDHTYSGDAANLKMALRPGGCFCETIPKSRAQIEHARVLYVHPGKTLRLSGGLGPLQGEGVAGALTWSITPRADGGSDVRQTYVVGGYIRSGAAKLAPLVDMVMNEQAQRLKAALE